MFRARKPQLLKMNQRDTGFGPCPPFFAFTQFAEMQSGRPASRNVEHRYQLEGDKSPARAVRFALPELLAAVLTSKLRRPLAAPDLDLVAQRRTFHT